MSKQYQYRKALMEALNCIDNAEGHAMSAIVNIALAGQYKELGTLYEEGDLIEVEPAMFEDTGDVNIDLILKLIKIIKETKVSIQKINSL